MVTRAALFILIFTTSRPEYSVVTIKPGDIKRLVINFDGVIYQLVYALVQRCINYVQGAVYFGMCSSSVKGAL